MSENIPQYFNTKHLFFVVILTLLFGVFAVPSTSYALSTSWNKTENKWLAYGWNWGNPTGTIIGWALGLENPNITISYYADVKNTITGTKYSSGASIPVGTKLSFTPRTFKDTDIYWFGSGYALDSPYGHWEPNASVPPESDGVNACDEADLFDQTDVVVDYWGAGGTPTKLYMPLSVNPPTFNLQHDTSPGSAGLQPTGGNNYTVTSPGNINSKFVYGETYGKFYYRYYGFNGSTWSIDCWYNNEPLRNGTFTWNILGWWDVTNTTPYTLSVPQKTINFTATVPGPTNEAPTPPTIDGDTVGNMDISYPFTFVSTDPENNALRYGIDWNNDSSVDQWVPGAGYTSSGTTESESRTWTTLGPRTFQVLAQDNLGNSSTWSAHTIDIRTVCDDGIDNDGDGDIDLADAGCDDPTGGSEDDPLPLPQCSDTLDNDGDTKTDYPSDPGCTSSLDNDETDPVPPSPNISISASPHFVKKGGTTDLSWNATNVTECSVDGPGVSITQTDGDPPDLLDGEISDSIVTGVINSESLYTLSCTGQDASDSKAQVTVRVVPTFEEF